MSADGHYPGQPGFKVAGPSQEASERVAPHAKTIRARVLAIIAAAPHGFPGDEVAARMGLEPWRIRARISELHAAKKVTDTPERRKGFSGLWITVWKLAPEVPAHD